MGDSKMALSRPYIVTSGVFDLLRRGHKDFLQTAKGLSPYGTLIVFLDSDKSVRMNRGEGRPITPEHQRARKLEKLNCVDLVIICREQHPDKSIIELHPEYYVKGGDCTLETMEPEFRIALQRIGTKIVFIPREHTRSTTKIINRLRKWGKIK